MTIADDRSISNSAQLRLAKPADVPALTELIAVSVRELQGQDYSAAQREAALASVYGVDSRLIADGTYFVAEARQAVGGEARKKKAVLPSVADESGIPQALIVGCGGWSRRKTLFGGDQWTAREDDWLDPRQDAAKIRAFFVHPAWARRGIGSQILEACEAAAKSAGFARLEMGATLTGVPFYHAKGYVEVERLEVPLQHGLTLPIVRMAKNL